MSQSRKIMVLTGKRGGFGAMKPMLRLLRDDPAFELQLVVTDQHVSERFGRTVQEIETEFPVAAAVDMDQKDDKPESRARALGICLQGMADTLARLKPDLCVLYGDRGDRAQHTDCTYTGRGHIGFAGRDHTPRRNKTFSSAFSLDRGKRRAHPPHGRGGLAHSRGGRQSY
jgi:hypothetical protein